PDQRGFGADRFVTPMTQQRHPHDTVVHLEIGHVDGRGAGARVDFGLEPLEAQVGQVDVLLPAHYEWLAHASGRSRGNRMTSRMESTPTNDIAKRSRPKPRPPQGGRPCSRARTKSSSTPIASSSPAARSRACS